MAQGMTRDEAEQFMRSLQYPAGGRPKELTAPPAALPAPVPGTVMSQPDIKPFSLPTPPPDEPIQMNIPEFKNPFMAYQTPEKTWEEKAHEELEKVRGASHKTLLGWAGSTIAGLPMLVPMAGETIYDVARESAKHAALSPTPLNVLSPGFLAGGMQEIGQRPLGQKPAPGTEYSLLQPPIKRAIAERATGYLPTFIDKPLVDALKKHNVIGSDFSIRTFEDNWDESPYDTLFDLTIIADIGLRLPTLAASYGGRLTHIAEIGAKLKEMTPHFPKAVEDFNMLVKRGLSPEEAVAELTAKYAPEVGKAAKTALESTKGSVASKAYKFGTQERPPFQEVIEGNVAHEIPRQWNQNVATRGLQYLTTEMRAKSPVLDKFFTAAENTLGIHPMQRYVDAKMKFIPAVIWRRVEGTHYQPFKQALRRLTAEERADFVNFIEATHIDEAGSLSTGSYSRMVRPEMKAAYDAYGSLVTEVNKIASELGLKIGETLAEYTTRARMRFIKGQIEQGKTLDEAKAAWTALEEEGIMAKRAEEAAQFRPGEGTPEGTAEPFTTPPGGEIGAIAPKPTRPVAPTPAEAPAFAEAAKPPAPGAGAEKVIAKSPELAKGKAVEGVIGKDGAELADLQGRPLPLNSDGTVTLYHRTSAANAEEIYRTGRFKSLENTDEAYFSSKPKGQAEGYGDTVVEVKVKPNKVRLDDAFNDEIHVAVKVKDVKPTKPEPPPAPVKKPPVAPAVGTAKAGERAFTYDLDAKRPSLQNVEIPPIAGRPYLIGPSDIYSDATKLVWPDETIDVIALRNATKFNTGEGGYVVIESRVSPKKGLYDAIKVEGDSTRELLENATKQWEREHLAKPPALVKGEKAGAPGRETTGWPMTKTTSKGIITLEPKNPFDVKDAKYSTVPSYRVGKSGNQYRLVADEIKISETGGLPEEAATSVGLYKTKAEAISAAQVDFRNRFPEIEKPPAPKAPGKVGKGEPKRVLQAEPEPAYGANPVEFKGWVETEKGKLNKLLTDKQAYRVYPREGKGLAPASIKANKPLVVDYDTTARQIVIESENYRYQVNLDPREIGFPKEDIIIVGKMTRNELDNLAIKYDIIPKNRLSDMTKEKVLNELFSWSGRESPYSRKIKVPIFKYEHPLGIVGDAARVKGYDSIIIKNFPNPGENYIAIFKEKGISLKPGENLRPFDLKIFGNEKGFISLDPLRKFTESAKDQAAYLIDRFKRPAKVAEPGELVELHVNAPIYWPHLFPEKRGNFWTGFLRDSRGLPQKVSTPSWVRKFREGVEGFNVDPDVAARSIVRRIASYENDTKVFEEMMKYVVKDEEGSPVNYLTTYKKGDKIPEGYVAFWPEGRLKLYRGEIDLGKALAKNLKEDKGLLKGLSESIGEMFQNKESFARYMGGIEAELTEGMGIHEYLGATGRTKVYLIPKHIADRFSGHLKPHWFAPTYRNVINLWKEGTLAGLFVGRWQFNNFMGNLLMSVLDGSVGSVPMSLRMTISKDMQNLIPPEVSGGGLYGVYKNAHTWRDINVFGAANFADATWKGLAKGRRWWTETGFALQNVADDAFRGAGYLKRIMPYVRKEMVKRQYRSGQLGAYVLDNIDNVRTADFADVLRSIQESDPALTERIALDVSRNIYDFQIKTPREKVMSAYTHPFISWWKFQNAWVMSMAINSPYKLGLLNALSKIGRDILDTQWAAMGYDPKNIPDDVRYLIPVDKMSADGSMPVLRVSGGNPLYGVFSFKNFITGAAPIVRWGIDTLNHYDSYSERELKTPYESYTGKIPMGYEDKAAWLYAQSRAWSLFTDVGPYGNTVDWLDKLLRPYSQYETAPWNKPVPILKKGKKPYDYPTGLWATLSKLFGLNEREITKAEIQAKIKAELEARKAVKKQISNIERFRTNKKEGDRGRNQE